MENTAHYTANMSKMEEKIIDLGTGEPLSPNYAYSGLLFTVVFFQIVNKIVTGRGAPKSVQTDFWKWKNLYISWIHAVIVSIWVISCWVIYGRQMMEDLITYYNMHIFWMVAFSAGYFVYDFIDIVMNKQSIQNWEVLAHHIAVCCMFIYNLFVCRCLSYNCVALLTEINTVFLHSRKLMQMHQVDFQSVAYTVNKWLNLISFAIFRFGCLIAIMIGMFYWRHRVSVTYYLCLTGSMSIMTVINIVLFSRLYKSDVLRGSSYISAKKKKYSSLANGNSAVSNNNVHNSSSLNHVDNKED